MKKILKWARKNKLVSTFVVTAIFAIVVLSFVDCSDAKSCLASVFSASEGADSQDNQNEDFVKSVELVNVENFRKGASFISTTGQVESSSQVELRSQVSSKVKRINVGIGDKVGVGQALVVFDNADAYAMLLQAEAGLEAAEARLAEMEKGPSDEQYKIAEVGERNTYFSALSTLKTASNFAKNSVIVLSDIQSTHYTGISQEDLKVQQAKAEAVYSLLGGENAGRWNTEFVSKLEGGAYGLAQGMGSAENFALIDDALNQMISSLEVVRASLEAVPLKETLSSSEKTILYQEKNSISEQLASLTGAQSAILSARAQFNLVKAGASDEQIAVQKAQVKLASAGLNQARSNYNKTIITAPSSGVVSVLPVKLGELVNPGQLVALVVNTEVLEIKTSVDSGVISDIKVGGTVFVEGKSIGEVSRVAPGINPATKKVEVRIVVNDVENSGLVVGQFVNIDISISIDLENKEVENYLLPLEAIKTGPSQSFVFVVNDDGVIEQVPVELGGVSGEKVEVISGIDPFMEIVSSVRGLESGQKVNIK